MVDISKGAVDRAGDVLRKEPQDEDALDLLAAWRALHASPLQKAVDTLNKHCYLLSINRSSRLKRAVSIIDKLKRQPEMRLSRMQDIAGVRLVAATEDFGLDASSVFDVIREYDYNREPKPSGYSAHHAVLNLREDSYKDFQIELQLRTYHQHLWAMAVETAGMFYGEALKASQGSESWLTFFKIASAAFSHIENRPVITEYKNMSRTDLRNELSVWGTEKTFFSKLSAIKNVGKWATERAYAYWLLELDIKKDQSKVYGFNTEQLDTAMTMYAAKEQTPACLRGDRHVVLVSTQLFKDLRQAYPSYFLDVEDFVRILGYFCRSG